MNETARFTLRAAVGLLMTMAGLWLVPDKSSAVQWLSIGVVVIALGGAIAGVRAAWFVAPLAYWVVAWTYLRFACDSCGEGEAVTSPATVLLAVTGVVAGIGMAGALASSPLHRLVQSRIAR